jgi:hypothetical protein
MTGSAAGLGCRQQAGQAASGAGGAGRPVGAHFAGCPDFEGQHFLPGHQPDPPARNSALLASHKRAGVAKYTTTVFPCVIFCVIHLQASFRQSKKHCHTQSPGFSSAVFHTAAVITIKRESPLKDPVSPLKDPAEWYPLGSVQQASHDLGAW